MKKVILIISGIIVVALALTAVFFYFSIPEMESVIEIEEITFPSGESVYLKKELRGLNYEVRVLSESPDRNFTPDPKKDYIYPSGSSLLYELKNDTLFLYVWNKSEIPENFTYRYQVQQLDKRATETTSNRKSLKEF